MSSRTCLSSCSRSSQSRPDFHLLMMRRPDSRPPSRHCVCDEMSQHTKQLRQGKKIRPKKKISPILSARSVSTGIQKCQPSLLTISLLFDRHCRWQAWCRRCSMIQRGPWCQHTKQLRPGKKNRRKKIISPTGVPAQRRLTLARLRVPDLKSIVPDSTS